MEEIEEKPLIAKMFREPRDEMNDESEDSDRMSMIIDSNEDDWACLHDILSNGQKLEYIGPGISILDVGFAQAREPLTPANHYFEITILDRGENCYIAIGLTRKDYPKNRHPGWDIGSIAYHADDGKLFTGTGLGEDFGPRCDKGDILGCGISFPSNYSLDDFLQQNSCYSDNSCNSNSSDSDASSDECTNSQKSPRYEELTIEVFFIKNGSMLGIRPVKMPHYGFFPSIGMLSKYEKVLVDLKPLTG